MSHQLSWYASQPFSGDFRLTPARQPATPSGEASGPVAPRAPGWLNVMLNPSGDFLPKLFAGTVVIASILMLIFAVATALVGSFASHVQTRVSSAMAAQMAALEYRKARVLCQRLPEAARQACIDDAHAAETRTRAVATLTPENLVAGLRSTTLAAIDAGDQDTIVVEPACSVVSRGQISLCEIQARTVPITRYTPAAAKNNTP